MKKITLVTEDGTTGSAILSEEPEVGQLVSIKTNDENGNNFQHEGYVLEVLSVEEY